MHRHTCNIAHSLARTWPVVNKYLGWGLESSHVPGHWSAWLLTATQGFQAKWSLQFHWLHRLNSTLSRRLSSTPCALPRNRTHKLRIWFGIPPLYFLDSNKHGFFVVSSVFLLPVSVKNIWKSYPSWIYVNETPTCGVFGDGQINEAETVQSLVAFKLRF